MVVFWIVWLIICYSIRCFQIAFLNFSLSRILKEFKLSLFIYLLKWQTLGIKCEAKKKTHTQKSQFLSPITIQHHSFFFFFFCHDGMINYVLIVIICYTSFALCAALETNAFFYDRLPERSKEHTNWWQLIYFISLKFCLALYSWCDLNGPF